MRTATSSAAEVSRRTLLGGLSGFALGFVLDERRVGVFEARAQSAAGAVARLLARGVRRFRVEFVWESGAEAARLS